MSNNKQKTDTPAGQLSLFEAIIMQEISVQNSPVPGSLNMRHQIIAALKYALRHAGKSREQVADEMTNLTGEVITDDMISTWLASSKPKHRFPLEYLPAFRRATGCMEPLNVTSRACGAFSLPGPDALRADIRKLDEQKQVKKEEEKAIDAAKRRLETLLQEVEGKR
ncbi:hypothetical protein KI809_10530 [Geobacter pelophilus]|uniref:Uncharacterized protein n=1 Tax=Geoanaerobacter pelophilus TaxID=60036 RepID=A0AAW4L832_9BACT|nr:hypothetical protein [Geoanaerobacter pelophilus]MBT0664735.1 hypothetical protein [Geoanaerobacter pelophilus]